jgi:hypothetical protein
LWPPPLQITKGKRVDLTDLKLVASPPPDHQG